MEILINILLIIGAYILGSIPFGLLLTKSFGMGDIRKIGSGNIGATNVMRAGNKKIAIATLLLDALKGVVLIIVAKHLSSPDWVVLLCALFAVLGHVFPVWLKFKGGKGVATTIAVYWALLLPLGIFVSIAWVATFYLWRISSASSITSIVMANAIALVFGTYSMFFTCVFITIIVVYKHKENILRLMSGEEESFSKDKTEDKSTNNA
jgi:glycerol-3-phosphate acyltransferase PlsY